MVSWQGLHLRGDQLAAVRGGRGLFAGLSVSLRAGEALEVAGPNGAGKTTLLRALCGLGRFDAGAVSLSGGETEPDIGEQSHYVGHLDALKPQLTARENLDFWAAYLGESGHGRGANSAKSGAGPAGLAQSAMDVPARFLSAGQKRKLALARLTLAARPLWLLDEPAVALDRQARADLARLMAAHLAQGGLIVAASHTDLGVPFAATITLGAAP